MKKYAFKLWLKNAPDKLKTFLEHSKSVMLLIVVAFERYPRQDCACDWFAALFGLYWNCGYRHARWIPACGYRRLWFECH